MYKVLISNPIRQKVCGKQRYREDKVLANKLKIVVDF